MSRRRKLLFAQPVSATVEDLSHDGRGVARIDGKTVFIDGALVGEVVTFRYRRQRRRFDEAVVVDIVQPSPHRITPVCAHAAVCGGCSLQHLEAGQQLAMKQAILAEQLEHFGHIAPQSWLPPLTGPVTGYRRKARLGVRYVPARERVLVGFREKGSSFLADLSACEVLVPALGHALSALAAMLTGLDARRSIPQIEVAAGDTDIALIFRHLEPLSMDDQTVLVDFCRERGWQCYLQPGDDHSVHLIWPPDQAERLYYAHPDTGILMGFHPLDFIQVNGAMNRSMVSRALELLDIQPEHHVLDLFCGLGNFSLPMATRARRVTGVEGGEAMVMRARENAQHNGLDNLDFHAWDLTQPMTGQPWAQRHYDRVLIDPPRSGALEVVQQMAQLGADKVLYVSCNPATLARDAAEFDRQGYRLLCAGVMDMFAQTTHLESLALFERRVGRRQ